jgi:plastocyanin
MKIVYGVCILVLLLVVASGCTQQQAAPVPTPEPTAEPTMPPATTVVPAATTVATPETAEATTVVTTAAVPTATPKPELTHSKTTIIYIRNNTFVPQEIMVLPGTGITWVNEDRTVHKIQTLPDIGIKFTSSDIVPGARFGHTFSQNEGSYGYIDPYTNATGLVIIKKGESVVGAPKIQTTVSTT